MISNNDFMYSNNDFMYSNNDFMYSNIFAIAIFNKKM